MILIAALILAILLVALLFLGNNTCPDVLDGRDLATRLTAYRLCDTLCPDKEAKEGYFWCDICGLRLPPNMKENRGAIVCGRPVTVCVFCGPSIRHLGIDEEYNRERAEREKREQTTALLGQLDSLVRQDYPDVRTQEQYERAWLRFHSIWFRQEQPGFSDPSEHARLDLVLYLYRQAHGLSLETEMDRADALLEAV